MFGRRKRQAHGEHHFALVTLNQRIMPMDRGERFEDPLDAVLGRAGLGEVAGGGTMQDEHGEIEYADIELQLHEIGPETVATVIDVLEKLGAAKGSKISIGDEVTEFGSNEGLALYVNGSDLPDEVYATSDINVAIERIATLLGDAGELHSHWEGPSETALYYYGPSYDEMVRLVQPYVDEYPLLERARLVRIA